MNTLSPDGLSALGLACEAGHVDVVQQLASHAAVDVNAGDAVGRTPLVAALEVGRLPRCPPRLSVCLSVSPREAGERVPYLYNVYIPVCQFHCGMQAESVLHVCIRLYEYVFFCLILKCRNRLSVSMYVCLSVCQFIFF